jgi:AcrR family transcriptional regulator
MKEERRTQAKQTSKRTYQQHRDRQRATILEAARGLFIQKGIQGTTLGDIAAEIGVSRTTIYQYFSNQTDIAWAILEENFEEFQEDAGNVFQGDKTGYEQIEAYLSTFLTGLTQYPEQFHFLAQFDVMYASSQEVERLLATVKRTMGSAVEPVAEAVRRGIADGSLRSDLDSTLAAAAVVNMAIAMTVRLEAHRQSVTIEYSHTPEQIFTEACQLLLRGMRAS